MPKITSQLIDEVKRISFFDLTGIGELHCDNTERVVVVELVIQAVNGRTRIHCSSVDPDKPFDLEMLAFSAHSPALKNVRIESAAGTLSAKYLTNVHVNYLSSVNENGPLLITQLAHKPGKRHTLTLEAGYLTVSSSGLTFDFDPSEVLTGCQLMFIGAVQNLKAFIEENSKSRTYLRFLTEMAGNSGTIDDRLLNGFLALEALFEGKKLQDDKISRRLGISRVTAKFIVELRNTFFHDGRSIKDTLDFLLEQKLKPPTGSNNSTSTSVGSTRRRELDCIQ